jgi:6-phosphogluconolactonase/glucosamine-6-phosphate isomerase/deaminase
MTVGPEVFARAAVKVVVACGAERAAGVRAARERQGPARELPARLVRDGTWIVDRAAARQLAGAHG